MLSFTDITSRLDQNCFTGDREGKQVLLLVCHNTCGPVDFNTAGQSAGIARQLSDKAANYLTSNDRQVSAHWLVGAESCGAPVYRIVPENYTAYHCGGTPDFPSHWINPDDGKAYGKYGLNLVSIGIEVFGQAKETPGPNQQAALKALVLDIVGRYPILAKPGHIVPHAVLEGDRQDGLNWIALAKSWVQNKAPVLIPMSYSVTIPAGDAVVRTGPGRNFAQIGNIPADPNRQYQVDGELHGELINTDDTWCHLPALGGYVTRTALRIVVPVNH